MVLIAVAGSALGSRLSIPSLVLIGVAILFIGRDASKQVWYRLMDAVDPATIEQIAGYAGEVAEVTRVQARYVGHELHAELVKYSACRAPRRSQKNRKPSAKFATCCNATFAISVR